MGILKINGTTIIQYAGSNFNEGLRINRASNDLWSIIHLGGAKDSIEGTCDGGWLLASNATGNFVLTHNGSSDNNGLVLQKDSAVMTYKGNTILHSGNYTSYTVTKTGTGASGTWGINITGNSATADYPKGFAAKTTSSTWGAISSSNYGLITEWDAGTGSNKGAVAFMAYPDSTTVSIKIDGYFYQNEGNYRVIDTSGGIISNNIGQNNHDGILKIVNTNTNSIAYHSPLRIMSAAVGTQLVMLGPANSEKNAGYIGFYNSGTSGSNNNFLTLGLYAVDNAINIYGSGKIGFWSASPAQPFSFYSKYNTATGCVADFWSNFSDASFIYFGGEGKSTYSMSVGYYKGLAAISNEATYARIGVTDAGKPQYWSSSTSGKYDLVVGSGYQNSGPIKLTTGAGISTASNNYISAGRGYSTGSGLYGIKLVATEQNDAISGIGQDCLGKAYELSVCAALGEGGQGYITFCGHKIASPTTYTELGFFDGIGNFKFNGSLVGVNGTGYGTTFPAVHYVGQIFFKI